MAGTTSVDNATNFKLWNQYGTFGTGVYFPNYFQNSGGMFDAKVILAQSGYGNNTSYTNGALNFGLNSTGGLNTGALNFGLNPTGSLNTGTLPLSNTGVVTPTFTPTVTPTPTISVQQKIDMQSTVSNNANATRTQQSKAHETQQTANAQTKPADKKQGFFSKLFSKEFWKTGGEALKEFGCSLVCNKDPKTGKWKFNLGKTALIAAIGVGLVFVAPAIAGALAVSAPLVASAITFTTGTLIPAAGTCWSLWNMGAGVKDYFFNDNAAPEQQKAAIGKIFTGGVTLGASAILGGISNVMKAIKAGNAATKLASTVETAENALTAARRAERTADAVAEAQAAAKAASGFDADVNAVTAAMEKTFKIEEKVAALLKGNMNLLESGNPKNIRQGIDGLKELAQTNKDVAKLLKEPEFAKLVGKVEINNTSQSSTPKNTEFAGKVFGKTKMEHILADLKDIKTANPDNTSEIDDIIAKLNQATKRGDLSSALEEAQVLANKSNVNCDFINTYLKQMRSMASPTEFLTYSIPNGVVNGFKDVGNGVIKFCTDDSFRLGALTATGRAAVATGRTIACTLPTGLVTYSKYTAIALAAAKQALIDGNQDAADQAIANVINTFSTELNTYNQYAAAYGMETVTNTIGSTDKDLGKIEEKINTMRSKMNSAIAKVTTVA